MPLDKHPSHKSGGIIHHLQEHVLKSNILGPGETTFSNGNFLNLWIIP